MLGACDQLCLALQQHQCVEIFPNFIPLTSGLVYPFPTEGDFFSFVLIYLKEQGVSSYFFLPFLKNIFFEVFLPVFDL